MSYSRMQRRALPLQQQGVVLLLALIMLVAMTMAGISLYRQIGTGLIISRNLSFKRTALVAADAGVEAARTWLIAQSSETLERPQQINGAYAYFSGWCNVRVVGTDPNQFADSEDVDNDGTPDGNGTPDDCGDVPAPSDFDPTTFNWANSALATADDGAGNQIRYVIHRLCETQGSINSSGQQCVVIGSSTAGNTNEAADYNYMSLANTSQPYFRITSRVQGPTNTVAFTQTILY